MSAAELRALAERCEAASGSDRELDLAIHLALDPEGEVARRIAISTRGFEAREGHYWDIGQNAFLYETRNQFGQCWSNGGIPIRAYTASLDAAMTLVPEGAQTVLHTFAEGLPHAEVFAPLPDNWQTDEGQFEGATPALALTAAALRARAAQEPSA